VLSLLAGGLRQAQIATRLAVSPKTVGKHIEHILPKLGVHSRTEAVAFALRNGVVGSASSGQPAVSTSSGDAPEATGG
jgi:DNA-binding NarL/FixJ family response regulator